MATAAIILALTLSYGIVAIAGYLVSFDKTIYSILRSQSNLFHTLAQWKNNELNITVPPNYTLNCSSLTLIYDNNGNLLWPKNGGSEFKNEIKPDWLKKDGVYTLELKTNMNEKDNCLYNTKDKTKNDNTKLLTYSVAVNIYPATDKLPEMVIVTIDTIPQDVENSAKVWKWFGYVLMANLLLVIPLILLAAGWSLKPINALITQIKSLENGEREKLDENPRSELKVLVNNLNKLLSNERERYTKYQTTLTDLAHSLKTPLAVLQSTLRPPQNQTIEQTESIMFEQIELISQQIKYSLHRANITSDHSFLLNQLFSVPILLNKLVSALRKVYQHKDVIITLDSPPKVILLGKERDFWEAMGNILDNACKYCRKLVKITVTTRDNEIIIVVDNDGLGVPLNKREMIFQRGLRANTLRPGQGLGLSIASEIIEQQYGGDINIDDSPLGGARVRVTFRSPKGTQNNHND
ncbi:sensor protein PhoQ [Xenorhabdus vietnamensis]|uniref:histidine kinase n=2 Tax=Xenorhabdus vietnamensis TaxID=351656 RepID=A0A1Y2SBP4_9GAMM|nr:sensor protein PhoQ [Xenorhabdus vietnamensis]